jgi:transposase-like protein
VSNNRKKTTRKQPAQGSVSPLRQLRLALGDLVREALYDTVLVNGMEHVIEQLERERTELCGGWHQHSGKDSAYRGGHVKSSLVLGGRRVSVARPRVRSTRGAEVMLPSWAAWSATDPLERRSLEQMLVGVSSRQYERSLEALPEGLKTRGARKSAVSRRFIQATSKKLSEFLARDLSGLDLKVLLLDGVHVTTEHTIVAAVGIDATGTKHALGLWEGATENKQTCKTLLENLVERGLRTDRTILAVIDGSKALAQAVRAVFGKRVLIQRCQEHKRRNVLDALPEHKRASVRRTLNTAFKTEDHVRARRVLENLARSLEVQHPGAAASVREGLDEMLTLKMLGLSGTLLERTLSTTNLIENLIGQMQRVSGRVKRWRHGQMVLRWGAVSIMEAEHGFRRIKGYRELPQLIAALQRYDRKLDRATPESVVALAS